MSVTLVDETQITLTLSVQVTDVIGEGLAMPSGHGLSPWIGASVILSKSQSINVWAGTMGSASAISAPVTIDGDS
jgi:hypothetical protein